MQNIDYSRKLRSGRPYDGENANYSPFQTPSYSQVSAKPKSAFILLIGGILLFTSGMVVGIQLGQKESKFKENAETSFSNVGTKSQSSSIPSPTQRGSDETNETEKSSSEQNGSSPFPSTLKFPPKNDQINYMVQIGDFSPEEAVSIGKQLIESQPNLRGRIFRTSTGKLFAGYFYRLEDAKETLDIVKGKLPQLTGAEVKTIRF
ncbi:hypothetical protein CH354_11990 [Leptospira levettii]|uniref:hypothetical protein n=1 Tax=Leptospira levettii TaxID=2023178 RepID=UPI000C2A7B2A|nr:hypothetical protein [Leptospira levettii]MCW7475075.1 hypothetical protein [Leptospira levettii]PJZ36812.1 hypothetical protein CH354_11990 [Leptospira levettii]PJZ87619.1 hypothetical protein CH368_15900 [Leptospira levettii]PKA00148.1 hypothetical protein CH369_11445 [Leptospira levettii]